MHYKSRLLATTAAVFGLANAALAAVTAQDVARAFAAQGYTYVEVKDGPSQIKAEAVRDGVKIEVVYDKATGAVLDQETERASAEYAARTGVEFDTRTRDFVGAGRDDDDDDDRGRGRGRGSDDDDDDDDDRGRGRGGDDDRDDDDDRGRGGDDDDDDSDDRGRGGDDDDDDDDDDRGRGRGSDDDGGDNRGGRGGDSDDD